MYYLLIDHIQYKLLHLARLSQFKFYLKLSQYNCLQTIELDVTQLQIRIKTRKQN